MRITLVFLAFLLGLSLAWIVRQSINVRPWIAGTPETHAPDHLPEHVTASRLGLAVFLAVITSFFMLSISAYFMRMELGRDWIPVSAPPLLWLNTAVLVLASAALQRAWNAARRYEVGRVQPALLAGGLCTLAFIAGQALAWSQLHGSGHFLAGNPASSFFYLITALHALHVLGGLVAWLRTLMRIRRGNTPQQIRVSVELCTVYWHYLLLLWLALFGLLMFT
jgi:cytochrome c oxidase subunit III